jgi:O-antigen/teichoic acid export membrane protein
LVLSLLALGLILQSTMQVTALGISIEAKTYLFARLSWVAAALNFVLNWALIPSVGAVGAAVATSLSYAFLTCGYLYHTQRLHPLPLVWSKLFLVAVLWGGIALLLIGMTFENHIATSLIGRVLLMLIVVVACISMIPWRKTFDIKRSISI